MSPSADTLAASARGFVDAVRADLAEADLLDPEIDANLNALAGLLAEWSHVIAASTSQLSAIREANEAQAKALAIGEMERLRLLCRVAELGA